MGEEYREKETERVKKYNILIDALTPRLLQKKRKKRREWTRKYRENLKNKAILVAQSEEPGTSRGTRSQPSSLKSPIIIDFQFNKLKHAKASLRKEVNTRKRESRREAKAYKEIAKLQDKNERLRCSNEKYRKKIYRDNNISANASVSSTDDNVMSQQAHLEVTWILV